MKSGLTDGMFGLGREKISMTDTSFIARAVLQEELRQYEYAVMMAPHALEGASDLVLGGFDDDSFSGNLTWFPVAGETGWNSTVTNMTYGEVELWNHTENGETIADF